MSSSYIGINLVSKVIGHFLQEEGEGIVKKQSKAKAWSALKIV